MNRRRRSCAACGRALAPWARSDAEHCSTGCRVRLHRADRAIIAAIDTPNDHAETPGNGSPRRDATASPEQPPDRSARETPC